MLSKKVTFVLLGLRMLAAIKFTKCKTFSTIQGLINETIHKKT